MSKPQILRHAPRHSIPILILLALLLYLIVPHLGEFKASWSVLGRVRLGLLVLAVAVSLVAHGVAGVKYQLLAFRQLSVKQTILIQLAGLLTNRVLPAGVGGMGINYLYLRKNKHSVAQAGAVISMNNLLGLLGHMALVIIILLFAPSTGLHAPNLQVGLPSIVLVVLVLIVGMLLIVRRRLRAFMSSLLSNLLSYRIRPLVLLGATLCSILIAASYAGCLLFSAMALGQHVRIVEALIVLTMGVAVSAVVPTPGGLVGVEAALVAGLTLYHISPADALAVALLYRFITYWFALLLGGLALVYVEQRKII